MSRYKLRPCPGCREEHRNPVGTLCAQCRADLKRGARSRQEQEEALKAGNLEVARIGRAFAYASDMIHPDFGEIRAHDVLDALIALANLPAGSDHGFTASDLHRSDVSTFPDHSAHRVVLVTPVQRRALETVLGYIVQQTKAAYTDGFERGRNLLVKLASGELTVEQFNTLTMKT